MVRPALANRRRRRGVTVPELALVLSLLLSLILAVFDYAQVIMTMEMMNAGADMGARMAAAGTDKLATADIQKAVLSVLQSPRLKNVTVQVYASDANGNPNPSIATWNDTPFGTSVVVQVDGDFPALMPSFGILPNPIHLKTKAFVCSEAN